MIRRLISFASCAFLATVATIAFAGYTSTTATNTPRVTFAQLSAVNEPSNGALRYCTNCTQATPCVSGGAGAFALRINGAWDCRGGGTSGATGPTGATGATGATGTAGTNGTNGAAGATGATGATGPAGAGGVTSVNSLTGALTIAAGTSGSDVNIAASGSTVTVHVPDAGPSARGAVTTGAQTIAGAKTLSSVLKVTALGDATTPAIYINSGGNNYGFFFNNTSGRLTMSASASAVFDVGGSGIRTTGNIGLGGIAGSENTFIARDATGGICISGAGFPTCDGYAKTATLKTRIGTSTSYPNNAHTSIAFDSASTGNTAATETDIRTTTLVANALGTNGDGVHFTAAGSFANTVSTNKRLIVYFGGTAIFDSGSLAITSSNTWRLSSDCWRDSSTSVKCTTIASSSATGALTALSVYTAVTSLTLSNTQVYKITGNGTNASDVTAEVWEVYGTVSPSA
jgi:hypothetical protein